jgi:solute carrier family 40 (iron-regulated transporter), member 1
MSTIISLGLWLSNVLISFRFFVTPAEQPDDPQIVIDVRNFSPTITAVSMAEVQPVEAEPPTLHQTTTPADPSSRYHRWSLLLFYTSHFLFTWNDRVWEFASVILLVAAFPSTLLPSSVFGLTSTAAAIVFSPSVGRWFDNTARLKSVRYAIFAQRVAVGAGCICLWIMVARGLETRAKDGFFVGVVLLGCIAKLAFVGKTVGIERDWV